MDTVALAPRYHFPISVDEYHRLIDRGDVEEGARLELIEGVIVAVSPQSREHAHAIRALLRVLHATLGPEWAIAGQLPLTLARSEPEPDVSVVRQEVVDAAERHPPTASLVVEVARSSLVADRGLAAAYAEAGVDEYWIVDVVNRLVEVHRDPAGRDYRAVAVARPGDTLEPVRLPGVAIDVSSLFR